MRARILTLGSFLLLGATLNDATARAQDARVELTTTSELMEESTRERVQERLESIAERLRECLGEPPQVDALRFELSIDRDGAVTRLAGEGAGEAASCARTLLQRLRFDPSSTPLTFGITIHAHIAMGALVGDEIGGGFGFGGVGTSGASGVAPASPRVTAGNANVRGSLSREVIQRVIRRHLNRVRYCYERALVQDPSLQGRISVRFVIAPDGNIQSASASGDTIGNGSVQSCVVQVVRTMRFPAPAGGGIVVVTYPFVFAPGPSAMAATPSPSTMTPVVRHGSSQVHGPLDRTDIMRVVRRNQAAVRYCYEVELQRAPRLEGRITVQFDIASTGSVASARIGDDTMGNARVASCIARQVRRWRFPQPEGGGNVSVSYPFVFTSR